MTYECNTIEHRASRSRNVSFEQGFKFSYLTTDLGNGVKVTKSQPPLECLDRVSMKCQWKSRQYIKRYINLAKFSVI